MKFKALKGFIEAVEKKYGEKAAAKFNVEVQRPFWIEGEKETFYSPHELDHLGLATYQGDKKPTVIIR